MALATGLIQPGSKVNLVERGPKHTVNNVDALKQKLSVLRNNLAWTERLDLTIKMVRFLNEMYLLIIYLLGKRFGRRRKSENE